MEKPLEVRCNDIISACSPNGEYFAIATKGYDKKQGRFSGISNFGLLLQSRDKGQYEIVKSNQTNVKLNHESVHALACNGKMCYAGIIDDNSGTIMAYEGDKIRATIKTDFKPCALTTAPDCVYCADDMGIIRVLNKDTLKEENPEKNRIRINGFKDREVKELFYLNEGKTPVLCARTYPDDDTSTVAVIKDNVLKETFDVQNNAFYAALVGGKTALFSGKGKEVTMRFLGETGRKAFDMDWDVCSLGFDSEYNCLYVGSGSCVKMYPYDPVRGELIFDKDKVKEINLNMDMKLSELKVGRIWEQ
jgi:hypothetical protein